MKLFIKKLLAYEQIRFVIVGVAESLLCKLIRLAGRCAATHDVVYKEVVKLVGADESFCTLRDLAVLRGKELGRHGSRENIVKNIRGLTAASLGINLNDAPYHSFGDRCVNCIHRHMVAVVGRPAENELG